MHSCLKLSGFRFVRFEILICPFPPIVNRLGCRVTFSTLDGSLTSLWIAYIWKTSAVRYPKLKARFPCHGCSNLIWKSSTSSATSPELKIFCKNAFKSGLFWTFTARRDRQNLTRLRGIRHASVQKPSWQASWTIPWTENYRERRCVASSFLSFLQMRRFLFLILTLSSLS